MLKIRLMSSSPSIFDCPYSILVVLMNYFVFSSNTSLMMRAKCSLKTGLRT